ncbi:hypothetical protein BKA67DRAFT_82836 [Truncatella angustata]|uniref:DUF7137 domain-containing protein n=1 Tax=Truncatella angustata TaxID=152316 RepID=A0A9P9A605_9PEZI|nr:uncharacterized protein BKA67DRAFT_82836 [Truncatella angustata]KAH6661354.1 hypothetical protein BKA67DRAFT_82836 [Truncatella angustata]KAH8202170.1 hypothetical protein TruAng_003645 [Truncatella angustata]
MKGPTSFLVAAVALSSTVSAWPQWLPALDSLVVRQDDSTTTSAPKETGTTTAESATETATTTATGKTTAKVITTNLNTGGVSTTKTTGTGETTGTGKESGSSSTGTSGSGNSTHTSYDSDDPAGGISMITPATTASTPLYRIGETITWAWNYTSLQGTPTAVDVLVSCSVATETWTLTQNMTFEPTGTYIWDTNSYAQTAVASPLLTEQYTLIIYDADSQISATAEPGYLSVYKGFTFGMYTARPYKDLGEWKCVTCSAANSNLDNQALRFAVGMATITVLTFTWFVAGFAGL